MGVCYHLVDRATREAFDLQKSYWLAIRVGLTVTPDEVRKAAAECPDGWREWLPAMILRWMEGRGPFELVRDDDDSEPWDRSGDAEPGWTVYTPWDGGVRPSDEHRRLPWPPMLTIEIIEPTESDRVLMRMLGGPDPAVDPVLAHHLDVGVDPFGHAAAADILRAAERGLPRELVREGAVRVDLSRDTFAMPRPAPLDPERVADLPDDPVRFPAYSRETLAYLGVVERLVRTDDGPAVELRGYPVPWLVANVVTAAGWTPPR